MSDCCAPKKKSIDLKVYTPLLVVFLYIIGGTLLKNWNQFEPHVLMNDFMGGFFIVFSLFKMINLSGFVTSYATYDVIAKRIPIYGWIYPFLELGLGILYLIQYEPLFTNVSTLILMSVSTIGVVQALLQKRKIQCACLGTAFNLPMTYITVIENSLMIAMSLFSILI